MDPVTPPASWVRTIVLRPGGAWDPHLSHLVDGMWIPARSAVALCAAAVAFWCSAVAFWICITPRLKSLCH